MKTIKTPAQITTFSSRSDGSLRFSVVTPELSVEEKAEFMRLQNQNIQALLIPEEFQTDEMEVEGDLDGKSPSSRLRAVLYVWWKTLQENDKTKDDFSLWYRNKMESIIDGVKIKIDEVKGIK